MQREITESGELLDDKGHLKAPGWSRNPVLGYDRSKVRASALRIKEWDYYCIINERSGLSLTIADNGYLGFVSATVFDFIAGTEASDSVMTPFPLGNFKMPRSSDSGDVVFKRKSVSMRFLRGLDSRVIEVDWPGFNKGSGLQAQIGLSQPEGDSMVIATPFSKKPTAFYYNQKINCLPATGSFEFGGKQIGFDPSESFAVLDWGRGVWTYDNTWYWGSCSSLVDNVPFGFNIGYGFGDTEAASENMIFYDRRAHKFGGIRFDLPADSFLEPWRIVSDDQRFEMRFVPILDRYSKTDLMVLESTQHQVFGKFYGRAVLDSGKEIAVNALMGFAEKVRNRW